MLSHKTDDIMLAVKNQHKYKVSVAEMRILYWMCSKIRLDRIKNDGIRENVGVILII